MIAPTLKESSDSSSATQLYNARTVLNDKEIKEVKCQFLDIP